MIRHWTTGTTYTTIKAKDHQERFQISVDAIIKIVLNLQVQVHDKYLIFRESKLFPSTVQS